MSLCCWQQHFFFAVAVVETLVAYYTCLLHILHKVHKVGYYFACLLTDVVDAAAAAVVVAAVAAFVAVVATTVVVVDVDVVAVIEQQMEDKNKLDASYEEDGTGYFQDAFDGKSEGDP